MARKFLNVSLLVGLLLFILVIYKTGLRQIISDFRAINLLNFLILLALRLAYWVSRTFNWKSIIDKQDKKYPLPALLSARLADHAISYLTPSNLFGGEPVRAMMTPGANRRRALATIIVDKTIELVSIMSFTIIGVIVAISRLKMPGRMKIVFLVFSFGAALFLFLLILKQKKGFFTWIVNILARIKIKPKIIQRSQEKIAELDHHISNYYRHHPGLFFKIYAFYALTFLIWTCEIHLTLVYMDTPNVTLVKSFLIITLTTIAAVIPAIPGALGINELTNVAVF
ncbi:MAG: flippase-like domain-containing protein, partial [Candidatus Aminicenantes bacterium]|nr:flippase-like domain-containing protein [Candidatus Aminicenantes bacterium]